MNRYFSKTDTCLTNKHEQTLQSTDNKSNSYQSHNEMHPQISWNDHYKNSQKGKKQV